MMCARLLIAALLASATAPAVAGVDPLAQRAAESEDAREAHVGNECRGEALDGPRCHDDRVLVCQGRSTASYTACEVFEDCKDGACEEEACKHKADGSHCHDDHVVECSMGRTVDARECGAHEECKSDELRPNAASCQDVCQRKSGGEHCEDDGILTCQGGRTANVSACTFSQECKSSVVAGIQHAACVEKDCSGKSPGTYCMHGGVVECSAGQAVSLTQCPFYQECSGHHGMAQCVEEACAGEADGWHCKGDHRVSCSGFRTVDFEICPDFSECHKDDATLEPVCQSVGSSGGGIGGFGGSGGVGGIGGAGGIGGVGGTGGVGGVGGSSRTRAADYDATQVAPSSLAQLASPSAVFLAVAALAGAL